jgi:hypothetical protein
MCSRVADRCDDRIQVHRFRRFDSGAAVDRVQHLRVYASVPTSRLGFPKFIDAIAGENYHYRMRGHYGFDVEPLSSLAFLSTYKAHFARNVLVFNAFLPVFGAFGALAASRACTGALARRSV